MYRIIKIGMDVHTTNYTLCAMEPTFGPEERIFGEIQVSPDYKEVICFIENHGDRFPGFIQSQGTCPHGFSLWFFPVVFPSTHIPTASFLWDSSRMAAQILLCSAIFSNISVSRFKKQSRSAACS